ncbi:uncharacterized protein [Ptychodera flava]|uniref:uncharacterized protein isoform X2 n=1 Tax=Ptychodera flava TaxID=63121 RepID=UPI00396AA8A7
MIVGFISSLQCRGNSNKYISIDPYGNLICVQCSKCPPGTGVLTPCDGVTDTKCEICPAGTYSGTWSSSKECTPCKVCPLHQQEIRKCTSTRNAKCAKECDMGYFFNELTELCDPCSWCFPDQPEIAPPRAIQCMKSQIPIEYQCMPSLIEFRPYRANPVNVSKDKKDQENVLNTDTNSTQRLEGDVAKNNQTLKTDDNCTKSAIDGRLMFVGMREMSIFLGTEQSQNASGNTTRTLSNFEKLNLRHRLMSKKAGLVIGVIGAFVFIISATTLALCKLKKRKSSFKYQNLTEEPLEGQRLCNENKLSCRLKRDVDGYSDNSDCSADATVSQRSSTAEANSYDVALWSKHPADATTIKQISQNRYSDEKVIETDSQSDDGRDWEDAFLVAVPIMYGESVPSDPWDKTSPLASDSSLTKLKQSESPTIVMKDTYVVFSTHNEALTVSRKKSDSSDSGIDTDFEEIGSKSHATPRSRDASKTNDITSESCDGFCHGEGQFVRFESDRARTEHIAPSNL